MSSSSLTPEELRAAAEVHSELGPGYRDAVVESFLEKVGKEIDARLDARLGQGQQAQQAVPRRAPRDSTFPLAVISIVLGIPITAIVAGTHGGIGALLVIWIGIAVINVANALHNRPHPGDRRYPGWR